MNTRNTKEIFPFGETSRLTAKSGKLIVIIYKYGLFHRRDIDGSEDEFLTWKTPISFPPTANFPGLLAWGFTVKGPLKANSIFYLEHGNLLPEIINLVKLAKFTVMAILAHI